MLRVLKKFPLLSFKAVEEDDLQGREEWEHPWHARVCMYVFNSHVTTVHLHIHLGNVD